MFTIPCGVIKRPIWSWRESECRRFGKGFGSVGTRRHDCPEFWWLPASGDPGRGKTYAMDGLLFHGARPIRATGVLLGLMWCCDTLIPFWKRDVPGWCPIISIWATGQSHPPHQCPPTTGQWPRTAWYPSCWTWLICRMARILWIWPVASAVPSGQFRGAFARAN